MAIIEKFNWERRHWEVIDTETGEILFDLPMPKDFYERPTDNQRQDPKE